MKSLTQGCARCCRHNAKLAVYGTTENARALMLQELSGLAESNPALRDRMIIPHIPQASLRTSYAQRSAKQHSMYLDNVRSLHA